VCVYKGLRRGEGREREERQSRGRDIESTKVFAAACAMCGTWCGSGSSATCRKGTTPAASGSHKEERESGETRNIYTGQFEDWTLPRVVCC
jgi:hypothetical protein